MQVSVSVQVAGREMWMRVLLVDKMVEQVSSWTYPSEEQAREAGEVALKQWVARQS